MHAQGRRTFVRLVILLLVSGGLRLAWRGRTPGSGSLPGTPASLDLMADSAARLAEAEARRSRPLGAGERLDPNRAAAEELDRLPGVGAAIANAIVRARDTLPFSSVDDLVRVRGIGSGTVAGFREHLVVQAAPVVPGGGSRGSAGPGRTDSGPVRYRRPARDSGLPRIDVNRASREELEALPGVGPVLAERIVAWRSRHGRFETAEELEAVSGIGPVLLQRLRPRIRVR